MALAEPVERTFSARLDCHYLLAWPETVSPRTPLVVALHGFGGSPREMLRVTERLFGDPPVLAALQGPYQFFRDSTARDVGYGWITNRNAAESIRLHRDMVSHVFEQLGREFDIPPGRRILAGFSQAVALNYRFAATFPDAVRGVIAICGGLPGDWETGDYRPVSASVLHVARRGDEYYKPETTERYPDRLRLRASDVEFHLIDGGHQVPSAGAPIVDQWLARVIRSATST